MPIPALDRNLVDQMLESALQRRDFAAIRVALNYEGYEIPVNEPNNFLSSMEQDRKAFPRGKDIRIQMTPEEYEMWKAPLEACQPEPAFKEPLHSKFMEVMAQNIPYRLERLIRRRDVEGLRMWLRLYGHDISPTQPGNEGLSHGSETPNGPSNAPEFHQ